MEVLIAGVDEAGRGCLAGPVVAGAVIVPRFCKLPGLDDSKKVPPEKRAVLYDQIRTRCTAWAVGVAWVPEINKLNIHHASLAAMRRAVTRLKVTPGRVLIDGKSTIPGLGIEQEAIVDGDAKVRAISAGSIVAKVFRDRLMAALARRYPGYGFEIHKGYGTRIHQDALRELGICKIHRTNFRFIATLDDPGQEELCLPGT
jgi:ribonuclease HII